MVVTLVCHVHGQHVRVVSKLAVLYNKRHLYTTPLLFILLNFNSFFNKSGKDNCKDNCGVKIDIPPLFVDNAMRKARELGVLNNSIMKGEGNLVGFLGEEIVGNYLGTDTNNTYDYDLIYNYIDLTLRGKFLNKYGDSIKIDVKTKSCTSEPKSNYNVTVSSSNTFQKCDIYVFTRVLNSSESGWILGWYDKEQFYKDATFREVGERDGNFTFRHDCYNLPINKLNNISELLVS